jgi:16S rRNA (cytidine1402-2'-O)-methyltransferase
LVRELTKLHEEVFRTTLAQAVEHYTANTPRGEFVLVVAGAQPKDTKEEISFEEAVEMVKALQQQENLPASEAAKRVAKETGYKKSELYKAALA